jgi:hypothetical protein
LDFSPVKVDALIRHGSDAARTALTGARCLPHGAPPAAPFFPRRVTRVDFETTNLSERLALRRLLGLGLSDTLDPDLLRSRVRHLATSEAYQAVWLSPGGAGDSISFDVSVRRTARRVAGLGLAYDNELGGRMWVGAVDRRLLDMSLEGSSALFLGEFRKELYLGFRRNFQLGRQLMTPTITTRLATESVRRFDAAGNEFDAEETREVIGFTGVERTFQNGWQAALGLFGHDWHEPGRDLSTLGVSATVTKALRSRGQVFETELLWTGAYRRAALDGEIGIITGGLRLRPRLRLGWGDRLPLQATFPLGGDDGFPGLHLGERRGDRETFVSVLVTYGLKGPFVGRLELATGRSVLGGPLLDTEGWLAGARVGLGAETPVGPVRFEYGVTSGGRGAVFVRLGRWF